MALKRYPALLGFCALISLSSFTPTASLPHYEVSSERVSVKAENKLVVRPGTRCSGQREQILSASQGINALRNVYENTLGYASAQQVPLKGRYFCSRTAYEEYKETIGSASRSSTGFFSRKHREIVVMAAQPSQGLQTLMHEASHALLRSQDANYSKWLNEGLAEYFEGANWDNGRFRVSPQMVKDKRLKRLYSQGKLPSLRNYLSLSNYQWQNLQKPVPIGSSMAWSLVYYLMENPQHHAVLRTVIREQRKGISGATSLARHYPGGLSALDNDWQQFIQLRRHVHDWQRFA